MPASGRLYWIRRESFEEVYGVNADKPANGGGKPSLNAVIRAIRDWFAGALDGLTHKVWPAVRSFTTRMVGAIGRALRRGAAQLGPIAVRAAGAIRSAAIRAAGAIARAARHLVSLGSQVIGDLRPSATSADPAATSDGATSDGVMSAGNAKSSAANNAAKSSAGTAHVYLVRRIVVFGSAALVVLAIVLGIVFGVRALAGNGAGADDAGSSTQSQAAGGAGDHGSGSGSGKDGAPGKDAAAESQSDDTDGKDNTDSKNNANTSDQQSTPEPLTDDERAAILAKAEQTASESGNGIIAYTYCVASKGEVGDLTEFSDTVFSTLNDPRGWPRAGAVFQEADGTDPNACSMTLTLAAADQMTSFSTECSDEYSCRVGNDVIINIDRWNNATEGWRNAGGTVERYRTMVINHEVGHRLGHLDNELTCPAVNQPAPLMQQQSMDLLGCVPNEWPLDEELWVSE